MPLVHLGRHPRWHDAAPRPVDDDPGTRLVVADLDGALTVLDAAAHSTECVAATFGYAVLGVGSPPMPCLASASICTSRSFSAVSGYIHRNGMPMNLNNAGITE